MLLSQKLSCGFLGGCGCAGWQSDVIFSSCLGFVPARLAFMGDAGSNV